MARHKRKSFGILYHRGASQTSVRQHGPRTVTVKVDVWRHTGGSRDKQYCAAAYLPRRGRNQRKHQTSRTGMRSGDTACASTPTLVVKRALRLFATRNWY